MTNQLDNPMNVGIAGSISVADSFDCSTVPPLRSWQANAIPQFVNGAIRGLKDQLVSTFRGKDVALRQSSEANRFRSALKEWRSNAYQESARRCAPCHLNRQYRTQKKLANG